MKNAIALALLLTACQTPANERSEATSYLTTSEDRSWLMVYRLEDFDPRCVALTPCLEQPSGFYCPDVPPPQCSSKCLAASADAENCCVSPLYACPDDETCDPACANLQGTNK